MYNNCSYRIYDANGNSYFTKKGCDKNLNCDGYSVNSNRDFYDQETGDNLWSYLVGCDSNGKNCTKCQTTNTSIFTCPDNVQEYTKDGLDVF